MSPFEAVYMDYFVYSCFKEIMLLWNVKMSNQFCKPHQLF